MGWPSPHLPQSHHNLTTPLLAYFESRTEGTLWAGIGFDVCVHETLVRRSCSNDKSVSV